MIARKRITPRQSNHFLLASTIIFVAAGVVAEASDLWLRNSPSITNLVTYNRALSAIPQAMSTTASVFMAFGLIYRSRKIIVSLILTGSVLVVLSFILTYLDLFSTNIEYYPGYYTTISFGPLAVLFFAGIGTIVAAFIAFLFRDILRGET